MPCRFLSCIDLKGTTYSASTLATGFGAYIAQPLLRKAVEGKEDILTEDEARKILEQNMRTLFYRDARSLNKVCNMLFRATWKWLRLISIKSPPSLPMAHQSLSRANWIRNGCLRKAL